MSNCYQCLSCINRYSCLKSPGDRCGYEKEEIGTLIRRAVEAERVSTESGG